MSEWSVISKKVRRKDSMKVNKVLTRDFIVETLRNSEIIRDFDLKGIFLYGSTSRNSNNSSSDIDIAVIFNCKRNFPVSLKNYLCNLFGKKIDLACFTEIYKLAKFSVNYETQCFIDNVITDSVVIIGNRQDFYSSYFMFTI